ncbi:MAG: DUF885 domain-containing protein [Deltaproteobacteria bacterium]|nr:MAG: DUF885 domain-containing protein [Deltaproteobacteria bacterium]
MRRSWLCVVVCLACSAATRQMPPPAKLSVSGTAAADTSASARLDGLARRYWKTFLETAPVTLVFDGGAGGPLFATALGDHRYDARLDDWSPAARRKLGDALAQLRSEASILDAKGLSPEEAITLEMLRQQITEEISVEACEGELWVVDQMNGPHTQLPQTWMYYPLGTEQGVSDLAARYGQVDRMFEQIVANLRRGMFQGKVSPRVNVQRTVDSLDTLLAKDAAASPLLPPLERFSGLADRAAARERIRTAIENSALPGLRRYRDFLAGELLPRARTDVGLWALPGGETCYASLVAHHTGGKRSPQEIHDFGTRLLAAIAEEMQAVAKEESRPDIATFRAQLGHRSDQFKRTPEELLAWNRATLERATAALPTAFRNPAPLPIVTRPIEAYRAASNVPAFYQPAPDGGAQPAVYYVNIYKAETRPLYNGEALCFHETVPGHHLQGSIAQKLSLPDFRRQMGQTAYVEGWALYAERLADEMHLYSGAPARFGMLGYQAWRASRLVVDTGMHALKWDREKALEFLLEHTTLTKEEAANEIDRYLVMPGQALGYMIGESEILRLRDQAQKKLGDKFEIKDFHDVVLSHGAVPLTVLARLVGEWMDRPAGSK